MFTALDIDNRLVQVATTLGAITIRFTAKKYLMNTESTASAAAAKVAAIRAYAYPEPAAAERAHAPGHCGCPHHGPSLWDLYAINRMSQTRCGSASSGGSTTSTDSGKPHWLEIVAGVLFLVCAVAVSVYDASKLLVLLAMVGEADALVLPLGGQASVLFDRWKRSELAFGGSTRSRSAQLRFSRWRRWSCASTLALRPRSIGCSLCPRRRSSAL